MPDLHFEIADAEALPFAAGPTILFKVSIRDETSEERIESILLRTQVRIETTRRHYDAETERRLGELFGEPHRWGETLRSMLWTNTTSIVPPFTGSTAAELPILCTYDFEVAAAKYFYALEDGEIPLLFLFSGTVFYKQGDTPMQIWQIPWESEAAYRLPVAMWKQMMNHYFPNSAWLRLRKDVFDRLYAYRVARGLPTWEGALEELLPVADREVQ